jgi:hypothetical protein
MSTLDIITTSENLTLNNTKKCFAELRLQIWNHALPPPVELKVSAEILTSSPQHELGLTFHLLSPRATVPIMHFIAHDRALSLLRVNIECRQLYISKLPIALPCGENGMGQLRMRREDILWVRNMDYLLYLRQFRRGLSDRYRLQDWWSQVQYVAIPIFSLEFVDGFAAMIGSLKDLRVLELVGRGDGEGVFADFLLRRAIGSGRFEMGLDSFVLKAGPLNNRMELFIRGD